MKKSLALFAIALYGAMCAPQATAFDFHENDRVIFLGNAFADRLRLYGYLETALALQNPALNLTFRDLGWPADEVALRPRPLNFGDIHQHLTEQKADVIFLFYGANESFAGKDSLEKFTQDYEALIRDILGHQYNGHSAPRVVLVSPIPQMPAPRLPDFTKRNADIEAYAASIKGLASANEIGYVDLFDGFMQPDQKKNWSSLTINGVHLNARGDREMSAIFLQNLGMNTDVLPPAGAKDTPAFEAIRARVVHKNRLFFDRWRAVNGYYIYGDRKEPFGVVSFPPEMKRFDELIAQEEAEIHKMATQPGGK